MNRRASAIRWNRLTEGDRKLLLHLVSQWFVKDKCSHKEIAKKMDSWMRKNAPERYDSSGTVSTQLVGRRIAEAAQKYGFLQVGRFYEQELSEKIISEFPLVEQVVIAPDQNELLRYAWQYLDKFLTQQVITQKSDKPIIVGVSGGRTMINMARAAANLSDLSWHFEVPSNKRCKVTICSLTSGGIRSDIAALSDTVSAMMAEQLGARARGLLGPAWFADSMALTAFRNDPDVKEHINLVKDSDIILTSVGYLGDSNALMRKLLDRAGESEFASTRPNLADMLYNCYDGLSGECVPVPGAVTDHLFSVMNLKELSEKVRKGSRCLVLAVGEQKGRYALPGVLRRQMASHIYMDLACAKALVDVL
jgi:DNA-binding transcriptional regulator LsrR (DeoR family)